MANTTKTIIRKTPSIQGPHAAVVLRLLITNYREHIRDGINGILFNH